MSRLIPNTDELVAWCERNGLDPSIIPTDTYEVRQIEGQQWRVTYEVVTGRSVDGWVREARELVTSDQPPPLWLVEGDTPRV